MELKYGKNAIYLGDSQENYDAIIEYAPVADGVVDAYHTFVKKELGGQGIAGKLVEELAVRARKEGFKVRPSCSYAVKKMVGAEEYEDVLYKE